MKTIETERLILRDWIEDDIGCGVFDEKTIRYLIDKKDNYAVVLKETGAVIGTIGLNEDGQEKDPDKVRNVGFRILEPYQRRGLITEALECVIRNAGEITEELSYMCPTGHHVSRHIAEKFGFQYVRTLYGVKNSHMEEPMDFLYFRLKL